MPPAMWVTMPIMHRNCRARRRSATSPRQRKRQLFTTVLLLLAGSFCLMQLRTSTTIISPSANVRPGTSGVGAVAGARECHWRQGGAMLYSLAHSRLHSDASHWFHVAECFLGRRAEFKAHFAEMQGARVYIQDADTKWIKGLTPMTRLFIAAGLSSVGVGSLHFIDGTHSSFSYLTKSSAGGDGVGVRGGRTRGSRPESGQVGVLHLDQHAYNNQFVVSADQPLADRLVVSAPAWASAAAAAGGRESSSYSTEEERSSSREVPGGEDEGQCVKFVAEAGTWGQKWDKWFPNGTHDARSLRLALHHFCPISWLEEGEGGEGGMDRRVVAEVAQGQGGVYRGGQGGTKGLVPHYNSQPRKVVIYKRDRNRELINADTVAVELWERLGHIGWHVVEIVHDPNQHPCELVNEISTADVLLTSHGFQSMLVLFMRPGTVLFEIYPHKYSTAGFEPLAKGLGVRYGYASSRPLLAMTDMPLFPRMERCMEWYLCRWYVRRSDVELSDDSLEVLIRLMLKEGLGR